MKKSIWFSVCLVLSACGGGGDSDGGVNFNPSFRAEYQEDYEFAQAIFKSAIQKVEKTNVNADSETYKVLFRPLDRMISVIPLRGFSVPKVYDSLNKDFSNLPPMMIIESVEAWVMCHSQMSLGVQLSAGVEITPDPPVSYVHHGGSFEYKRVAPQYKADLQVFRYREGLALTVISPRDCEYGARTLVKMKVMSEPTLNSLNKWQSALANLKSELRALERESAAAYPYVYKLHALSDKLEDAFSELP